jgi:hypothetical protein
MFDHPAWVNFERTTGAREHVWDQCMHADDPTKVPIKSSVWLATPNLARPIAAIFGVPPHVVNQYPAGTPLSLCQHPGGTHKALRGTDSRKQYVTSSSGSENYCAGTNRRIAEVIHAFINSSNFELEFEIAGVAGVIRGEDAAQARGHSQFHS